MLQTIRHLKGFTIRAVDGDLGTAEQLYFDDESWTVRYLTVETGRWLEGRKVLISPFSITSVNWQAGRVNVSLTKKQIEDSPDIDLHQPVSRQHETAYLGFFGYPNYWAGPYEWGPVLNPMGFGFPVMDAAEETAARAKGESKDSHLRSTGAIRGYDVQATDGEIGHVTGFVLDDESWAIRYLEIGTRNWWPGKKVLMAPAWIKRVSWLSSKVYVALTREAIQTCPEYVDSVAITREFENRIYFHYGRPPYWEKDAELSSSLLVGKL